MKKQIKEHLLSKVTEKDKSIVQFIANGFTPAEVGKVHGHSGRTIESMLFALRNSFELRNTTCLVTLFFREGLIK